MKRLVIMACLATLAGAVSLVAAAGGAAAGADLNRGKTLFTNVCSLCHGTNGDGKGPGSAALNPKPASMKDPPFWKGDVEKKIRDTVKSGKGMMPPQNLKADEVNDVIAYISQTFKPASVK